MPSEIAKKAAGTYIPDGFADLPAALAWATQECRVGGLAATVKSFCEAQPEILEQSLVLVENITGDCIHCRIPCRCSDHETAATFEMDVRFRLDPKTGACERSRTNGI